MVRKIRAVHDGSTSLTGAVTIGGLIDNQTLSYTNATASNANVATPNKYISLINLTDGTNGGVAGNYVLPTLNSTNAPVTINAKAISLSGSKTYDATSSFAASTFGTTGTVSTGVGVENLVLTGTGSVANANVSAGTQALTLGTLALTNGTGLASNYTLDGATSTGVVTAKTVMLSGSKNFDATVSFAASAFGTTGTVSTGVNNETLVLTGIGSVASANASAGTQTLSLGTLVFADSTGRARNYVLAGGTGKIIEQSSAATASSSSFVPFLSQALRFDLAADATGNIGAWWMNHLVPIRDQVIITRVADLYKTTSGAVAVSLPMNASDMNAELTLSDGRPIPEWLRFVPPKGLFVDDCVPNNALPIDLFLRSDGRVIRVFLTER